MNSVVSGWRFRRLETAFALRALVVGTRRFGGAAKALRALRVTKKRFESARGNRLQKAARIGERHTFDLYVPAFPSRAADRYLAQEMRRFTGFGEGNVLQTAIVAITKECPLRCEHCCEWDALNQKDTLRANDLREIVSRLEARGVTQIFFSGGEPLRRLDDLIAACAPLGASVDTWIITSGVGLTEGAARRLRDAGFTGVVLSVDHWDEHQHDAFRGRPGVFRAAMAAAANATGAGLALAFSLCPTREFATRENLDRYTAMVTSHGGAFIQIMEPRQVGHFAGRDVLLGPTELATLEVFADEMNFGPAYLHAPLITYPALIQRRLGCLGAGNRYLYIDTDGEVHACPFCRSSAGNAVREPLDDVIACLRERGCGAT